MNLTISVLEGLLLLLPGLTALGAWNFVNSRGKTRRPELPLAAVNALAIALLVSIFSHLVGAALAQLVVQAGAEWNAMGFLSLPALTNPYSAALGLLSDHMTRASAGSIFSLLCLILFECAFLVRLICSRGVGLALASHDLQGVGWAHKHVIEPLARGYTPVAFVMLKAVDKGRGLVYAGPIDDLTFGAFGEVASISLGQPQRFIYEVRQSSHDPASPRLTHLFRSSSRRPNLALGKSEWVGGVVHLAAANSQNIVVHNFAPMQVKAFNARVAL